MKKKKEININGTGIVVMRQAGSVKMRNTKEIRIITSSEPVWLAVDWPPDFACKSGLAPRHSPRSTRTSHMPDSQHHTNA